MKLPIFFGICKQSLVHGDGVALDVCNRYAIDGLLTRRPSTRLRLVTDATRPIDVRRGRSLLEHWRERGVELIRTDDALGERVA